MRAKTQKTWLLTYDKGFSIELSFILNMKQFTVSKHIMKWVSSILFVVLLQITFTFGSTVFGEEEFDRYRVILERKPFGEAPPPDTIPQVSNPIPSESFAKTIRMSALVDEDGEMKVGLIDIKSNESFFLHVGQVENGIELVSANYEDEEAVLRRGSEMALIKLQSGEIKPITNADRRKPRVAKKRKRPTYAERRRARRQRKLAKKKPKPPPPEPKFSGDELRKHLEDYQMELIRQGLPPLPLPLTPAMDEQLVEEGVLPAEQE